MKNNKKKFKILRFVGCFIIFAILFYVVVYIIKMPNKIYGIFNPPIEISEAYKHIFYADEEYYFDEFLIKYWDVSENEMIYWKTISDKEQVNEIYNLSKQIKVKQKFYNDTPLNYNQVQNIMNNDGFCYIEFRKEGGKETHFCIVGKRFFENGELSSFDRLKREIAECELFDYLDQFTEEYDPEKRGFIDSDYNVDIKLSIVGIIFML